ncbi:MAG: HEAT repeat domain-containing protein [Planctomycetota bacterium]
MSPRRCAALATCLLLLCPALSAAQEPAPDPRLAELAALRARGLSAAEVERVAGWLADPVGAVRRAAARTLVHTGAAAVPALTRAFAGPSARGRRAALRALEALPASALAPHQALLCEAARPEPYPLARTIARLGDEAAPETVRALLRLDVGGALRAGARTLAALLDDPDLELRRRAVRALWSLGVRAGPARARLVAGFTAPPEGLDRPTFARCLAEIGELEPLLAALERAESGGEAERELAVRVLGVAGWVGELGLPVVLRGLRARRPELRRAALGALVGMKVGRGFVPADGLAAVRALLAHPDRELAAAAASALGEIAGALPDLLPALRSPAAKVRVPAVQAVGNLAPGSSYLPSRAFEDLPGAREARAATAALAAHDPDPEVRLSAAYALRPLVCEELRAPLLALLRAEDAPVRACAALALGDLSWEPETARALAERLQRDPDQETRGLAAEALGRLGASEPLARALDARGAARLAACRGLAGLGIQEGAAPIPARTLLALLGDEAPEVRRAAGEGLAAIAPRDAEAREAIPLALADEDAALRLSLCDAISGWGDPQAYLALIPSRSWELKTAAARAWGRDPAPAAVEAFVARLNQPLSESEWRAMLPGVGPLHAAAVPRLRALCAGELYREAIEALARIGLAAAPALPELLAALPARESALAIGRLGELGGPAVPALVRALEGRPGDYPSEAIFTALGQIGAPAGPALRALPACFDRVHGITPVGRFQAVAAIVRAGGGDAQAVEVAVGALVAAIDTSAPFWPGPALEALGAAGPRARAAAPTLLDHALDPWADLPDRYLAGRALLAVDPERAPGLRAGLMAGLAAGERAERVDAALLLGWLGQELGPAASAARVLLEELLAGGAGRDPKQVCAALADLGPCGVAALGRVLASGRDEERLAAVEAGDPVVPELQASLQRALCDREPQVRRRAAARLAGALPPEAPPELVHAVIREALRPGWNARHAASQLTALGPRAAVGLSELLGALGARELRGPALRAIAAIGSAAAPAAPRLRELLTRREPGCVLAACALLELEPAGDPAARAALREWLPSLPRAQLGEVAACFGRPRAQGWTPEDRALALRELERVLRYRGQLARGLREACDALLALGERARVEAIASDAREEQERRDAAQAALDAAPGGSR